MVLGLGTGESMNEVPLGLEWPDGKERFARFREAVRLIRELWAGERVSFEGDYYRTDKATIYDRPDVPVPMYLAGSGPAATRFAGRAGDGYITTSGKDPALYTDTLLPAVREGADKAERQLSDLDMMIEVKVSFDHDREAAMEATRFWGALALSPEEKAGVGDPVRDAAPRRCAADRADRVAIHRVERPGRARQSDRPLPGSRVHPSGVPRAWS